MRRIQSQPLALQAVIYASVAGCAWLSASALPLALVGRWVPLCLSVLVWIPLAIGLWTLHRYARRVAVGLLWILVIVLPLGVINPFAAMEGNVPTEAPAFGARVLALLALEALALFALHVLGRYKSRFEARSEDAAED